MIRVIPFYRSIGRMHVHGWIALNRRNLIHNGLVDSSNQKSRCVSTLMRWSFDKRSRSLPDKHRGISWEVHGV